MDTHLDIILSVAPLPNPIVEYYQPTRIPITLTSNCSEKLVVESLTLRFQTDRGMADYDIKYEVGKQLLPEGLLAENIEVVPVPEFLESTNQYDIKIRYRKEIDGQLGDQMTLIPAIRPYIIVRPCSDSLGQLFISFKQPDDLKFARRLETVAKRAGFKPYLKMDESTPGQDMWEVIA